MEIEVPASSLRAFASRGRSECFTCPAGTESGTPATIKGQVDGKTVSHKGVLRSAGNKKRWKFTLHKS
tara:strand:+ start:4626 stop:4829 length:204 start_codon:yes stop_codon:yes gene_type:complete